MKRESQIQDEIRLALQACWPGLVLWRNNTGQIGAVKFGLCNGSSDLIGIFGCEESDEDFPFLCGTCGRFVAIECKRPGGRVTKEQAQFLALVRSRFGIAFVAHSAAEAVALMESQL